MTYTADALSRLLPRASSGVAGAAAGTLSFLVGGTQPAFRQAEPLLASMGKRIIHCGPSGSGLAAKICNNLMLGVQQIATAEAMLLGEELGLDPGMSSPPHPAPPWAWPVY